MVFFYVLDIILEPEKTPSFKWMEMVISNHFLYKDLGTIIQLIANHLYMDGPQVPGRGSSF